MRNKKAIYTVITDNYDNLIPINKEDGFDYVCFTDNKELKSDVWDIRYIEPSDNPCKQQRIIKIKPHEYLPEYDITVYIDGNMRVKGSIKNLFRHFKGGMTTTLHPTRKCVYQEAKQVIRLKKAKKEDVDRQMKRYYELKFPVKFGMWADGFMIRDKSQIVIDTCDIWAKELMEYTHRDQLSIPYAVRQTGIKIKTIPFRVMLKDIEIVKHKQKKDVKVFYSTPFRSDKNIGKANNEFIELLPDNCWVCITDADAMFLQPDFGTQIENIIKENPNYGLIGCVTNRLRSKHQLYNNKFSEDMNVRNHYEISKELREKHGNKVEEVSGVAGVCMIFRKEVWKKARFFKEKSYVADTLFNKSVRRLGLKIGIAKGLYMFHSYRPWTNNYNEAANNINHLK